MKASCGGFGCHSCRRRRPRWRQDSPRLRPPRRPHRGPHRPSKERHEPEAERELAEQSSTVGVSEGIAHWVHSYTLYQCSLYFSLQKDKFDVLVIGGGATGTGCALDAATRGLKTAVVELDDFSSGTTSRSTKLIHGGVRYLQKVRKRL